MRGVQNAELADIQAEARPRNKEPIMRRFVATLTGSVVVTLADLDRLAGAVFQ
jgi:hypothetical protein